MKQETTVVRYAAIQVPFCATWNDESLEVFDKIFFDFQI